MTAKNTNDTTQTDDVEELRRALEATTRRADEFELATRRLAEKHEKLWARLAMELLAFQHRST